MWKTMLVLCLTMLCNSCTFSPGVVKDIDRNSDGTLTVSKCDLYMIPLLVANVYAERNCRTYVE